MAPTPAPTPEPTPPISVDASGNFEIYGKTFNLNDTSVDLWNTPVDDDGALLMAMMPFMPNLRTVDMDSCGVENEKMAVIRDAFPDVDVIWRIYFGAAYSVRTDVTRILASNSGPGAPGGIITAEDAQQLKYCTKVTLLDMGHTESMPDISFVQYMPDLEVAILAMATWCDATPLSYCGKLEYAELQTSGLSDLTPLANCKNLRHLNICHDFAVSDLSPLFDLNLDRLYIGAYTPIPPEQVAQFAQLHPNCEINTTTTDPTDGGWRRHVNEFGEDEYAARYAVLRDQFEYSTDLTGYPYSFYWNDNKCTGWPVTEEEY